ncbi:MAG: citramalate synthase [bacterium]
MKKAIEIYDTTLRDGAQAEGISFTLEDKLRIAQKLDEFGISYIEGGWPGSNPKDALFFKKINDIPLQHAKIAAFGSTKNPKNKIEKDTNIQTLLAAQTPVITIFGKSWTLHVTDALKISLQQNLDLIYETICYLKERKDSIFYDAEHFFDGYKEDSAYALKTLLAAQDAGVDVIVLCDTNGGTLPYEVQDIIMAVKKEINTPLGIHAHNDSELAVANSLIAVKQGIIQVQGTINGYGERCGNANLCSIIANLSLKMDFQCIPDERIQNLREVSRFVSELANLQHYGHQPFVGDSAFAHKGGIHVNAIRKNKKTYEHIDPALVGNRQRILISELSGQSNIIAKAAEYNLELTSQKPEVRELVELLKKLEHEGYQFEGADGSFELIMKKTLGIHRTFFDLVGFRVIIERRESDEIARCEATIQVKVGDIVEHTAADGDGPVNALDNALRKALEKFYPELEEVELLDFKVRILEGKHGTAARTRVLIESGDRHSKWGTVGVSDNIIEASWQALVDSIEYKLLKNEAQNDHY